LREKPQANKSEQISGAPCSPPCNVNNRPRASDPGHALTLPLLFLLIFKGEVTVVRTITKAVLFGLIITATAGCDMVAQKATGQIIKIKMVEICGEEDKGCLAAVDEQYGACETKYKNEWSAYMTARSSKEDALLDDYMAKLFTCVVDVDGDPYFEYSPG
jgi:hypothetical protein